MTLFLYKSEDYMSSDYYSSLQNVEKSRYKEKVAEISMQSFSNGVDPYQIKDGWVDDISLWPPRVWKRT